MNNLGNHIHCDMKKILIILLLILVILLGYLIFNTLTFNSKQIDVTPAVAIEITPEVKQHMSQAIQIPTISNENPADIDSSAFYRFRDFLKATYPLTDSLLETTYINEFSVVTKWPGSNPNLKPMIVMGHIDVVPVPEENKSKWKSDPFGGEIKNGEIWGRGAIDDKISVIGNMEAVEHLLREGYKPARTLYLCFGHDEEIGGIEGAIAIVEHLKSKGVEAEFVVDEGSAITQGLVPGTNKDVALIGTAEKGFVSLKLSLEMDGGHSSMPAKETTIDVLAEAITKLKKKPFPAILTQPVLDFMDHLGPEAGFMQKMAFANPGIFKSMLISTFEKSKAGNATVRTTTAPTIIHGGVKENVIPYQASATVNFRILPGTSIEEVKEHVKATINDDRIKITEGSFSSEAPGASGTDTFGYQTINKTIRSVFPGTITTPNLVIGATDSRHYYPISENIYRFTPFYLNDESLKTFHGINERISVKDFEKAIIFYAELIKNGTSE